jgi:hypothetical protein
MVCRHNFSASMCRELEKFEKKTAVQDHIMIGEVVTMININITIIMDVTPCSLVDIYQYFG